LKGDFPPSPQKIIHMLLLCKGTLIAHEFFPQSACALLARRARRVAFDFEEVLVLRGFLRSKNFCAQFARALAINVRKREDEAHRSSPRVASVLEVHASLRRNRVFLFVL